MVTAGSHLWLCGVKSKWVFAEIWFNVLKRYIIYGLWHIWGIDTDRDSKTGAIMWFEKAAQNYIIGFAFDNAHQIWWQFNINSCGQFVNLAFKHNVCVCVCVYTRDMHKSQCIITCAIHIYDDDHICVMMIFRIVMWFGTSTHRYDGVMTPVWRLNQYRRGGVEGWYRFDLLVTVVLICCIRVCEAVKNASIWWYD